MTTRQFGPTPDPRASERHTHTWRDIFPEVKISDVTFDSLRSSNYVESTTGFLIDTDGTANFNAPVITGADIYSANWDGSVPADLSSSYDAGATAGFYLDASAGSVQFEGTIWGSANGQIRWQYGSESLPSYSFRSDNTSGMYRDGNGINISRLATRVASFRTDYNLFGGTTDGNAAIRNTSVGVSAPAYSFYNDSNTGMYRSAADTIAFAAGGTAYLTIASGAIANLTSTRIVDGSVGTPAISFTSDTNTGFYRVSSDVLGLTAGGTKSSSWSPVGVINPNTNTLLPFEQHYTATDTSPASAATWTDIASAVTVWSRDSTRTIRTTVHASSFVENSAAAQTLVAIRIGLSFDGGGSWSYYAEQHGYAGQAAGSNRRLPLTTFYTTTGSATGNVQVKVQGYRAAAITNFRNIKFMVRVEQH